MLCCPSIWQGVNLGRNVVQPRQRLPPGQQITVQSEQELLLQKELRREERRLARFQDRNFEQDDEFAAPDTLRQK